MRVRHRYLLPARIAVLIGAASLPCAGQGAAPARTEAQDRADFQSVCGACHTPGMASDILSEAEWRDTVEKMVSLGARGTDEQMEAVIRYLLRTLTKVNINTAAAEQLPLVLDISEETARAVVKYRAGHGDFKSLDDLKKVSGVDAAKLDAREDRIVF